MGGAVMTERQDSVLTFCVMLAIGAAIAAAAGIEVMLGFVAGIIATLGVAAVTASTDFFD
jgi:hypothetical protein